MWREKVSSMSNLKIGDIVARKSYGQDIFFKVVDINYNGSENIATIKGIAYRIEADAPESDLVVQSSEMVDQYSQRAFNIADRKYNSLNTSRSNGRKKGYWRDTPNEKSTVFLKSVKILHVDGDNDYLEKCMAEYKKYGLDVYGRYIAEKDQPSSIFRLLQELRPDILVLTGHDGMEKNDTGYSNVENYKNSRYFIEAVREARRYNRDLDSFIIFAGACQSYYKGIIEAGANFASAPQRVNIHALDPVFVCQKIVNTSMSKVIEPNDVVDATITGSKGIGGIQTRGKQRQGYPVDMY
jgi:sporulation peptidase YabG